MSEALDAMSLAQARYSRVAMWFHWIIATLIIVNLLIGYFHDDLGKSASHQAISLHKSIGLTVLLLSLGRLLWRLGHRPPAFEGVMARWEATMARAAHWLFYGLMVGLPLSGWLMVSGGKYPTMFFGLFTVPGLPVHGGRESHEFWETTHTVLGYAMLVLLLLHVAGALKHIADGKRHLVGRMAPWISGRRL